MKEIPILDELLYSNEGDWFLRLNNIIDWMNSYNGKKKEDKMAIDPLNYDHSLSGKSIFHHSWNLMF